MATKALIRFLFVAVVLGSTASACSTCTHPTFPRPPSSKKPPKHLPPYTNPPVVGPPAEGGGAPPGTSPPATCSLDILKLGLCLDVLGGLVHVGLGKPAENVCCPVLQGLLELEAATCLCTAIKLRLLDLDIYIPLALQVLITCGKDPAPGYLCPLS
ncbi:AAI [Musa troglodytarum]|uniref:AAI n=1 Tax=Musa troglodytarum TaxID=320322 RepID=A0A9E7FRH3_9LILI|nr:AAI [Musa troglodytarum]URD98643.1 AAI [Musa troglodytarum]